MSEKCWFVDPTAEGGLTWGDPDGDPDDGWDVGEAFAWFEATSEVRESRDALVAAMAERETLRGIAKRLADGWVPRRYAFIGTYWQRPGLRSEAFEKEPMTEVEVHAIYGHETEEESDDGSR